MRERESYLVDGDMGTYGSWEVIGADLMFCGLCSLKICDLARFVTFFFTAMMFGLAWMHRYKLHCGTDSGGHDRVEVDRYLGMIDIMGSAEVHI